jgi:hypothetical protein
VIFGAVTSDRSNYEIPPGRVSALLPPVFFACGVSSFAVALGAFPFLVPLLGEHFYQPPVLAVTHLVTLGWVSAVIMGVLYRYVPGLTKQPLRYPRLAIVQWAAFVAGTAGLVASLWLGRWSGAAWSAGVLAAAGVLLCANLWVLIGRASGRGVAEVGIVGASGFLVAAALVGLLLAFDKEYDLLPGGTFTNLAAHVHLAALGWVGITICALSFRFLPAFLLPQLDLRGAARRQVVLLAAWVVLLVATLLASSRLIVFAALGVAAAFMVYLVLLVRMIGSHRMPIDWTARHAVASGVWLGIAIGLGLSLLATRVDLEPGGRLGAAYGVAALLGWMTNLVVGISYKLFPGFVAAARSERGRGAVPTASLGVPQRVQAPIFVLVNAGLGATVAGLCAGWPTTAFVGSIGVTAGGLTYVALVARTLAFTLVDPPRSNDPLRVLP